MNPKYYRDLRRQIQNSFSEGELRVLCFDLNIDWEALRGETKPEKVSALVDYQGRRGKLQELIILLKEDRPTENWKTPPPPNQQIEDTTTNISEAERREIFDDLIKEVGLIATNTLRIPALISSKIKYLQGSQVGDVIRLLASTNLAGYVNFQKVELANEDFSEVNLSGISLKNANLRNSIFKRADLNWADLSGANLSGVNFASTNLRSANLNSAILIGSYLNRAKLYRADLKNADLRKADLTQARLHDADLSDANLSTAQLASAYLYGSDLTNAKLPEGFDKGSVYYDDKTFWPDDI